jgi:hypothetical protein
MRAALFARKLAAIHFGEWIGDQGTDGGGSASF